MSVVQYMYTCVFILSLALVFFLLQVNLQQVMMDGKFGAVNRAVVILEKYKHPLPSLAMSQFEAVPHR